MNLTIISVVARTPPRKSRGLREDIVGAFRFDDLSPQPVVFCFQVDRFGRRAGTGLFVGADPHAQCFLAHAELVGDAGDRAPGVSGSS